VAAAEGKNTDQDKAIAAANKEIDEVGADLTKTKERLNDVDAKVGAAARSAEQAGQRADAAQRSADGAARSADGARGFATEQAQGVQKNVDKVVTVVDGINRLQMLKSETVLFDVNQTKLSADAKTALDEVAKMSGAHERFVIEVQGFTDKTGSQTLNEALSQARATEVTRYLVNQHKIPVRAISAIGSGYTAPIGDDKTKDGRAMNRRVEVRLFAPEVASVGKALAAQC
jgi:outer membrane protein OmpA-like peptidoglycan-associated protein